MSDLLEEAPEEEYEEESQSIDVNLTLPTHRVLLKAGSAAVEIESSESLSEIILAAKDLLGMVYDPDAERRATSTMGFHTEFRGDE